MVSVPITILLYNDPLFCGFNVPIKGLTVLHLHELLKPHTSITTTLQLTYLFNLSFK